MDLKFVVIFRKILVTSNKNYSTGNLSEEVYVLVIGA